MGDMYGASAGAQAKGRARCKELAPVRPLGLPETAWLHLARSLPKSALERPGGFGDGAPPGDVRAWIGLSGRFLALRYALGVLRTLVYVATAQGGFAREA